MQAFKSEFGSPPLGLPAGEGDSPDGLAGSRSLAVGDLVESGSSSFFGFGSEVFGGSDGEGGVVGGRGLGSGARAMGVVSESVNAFSSQLIMAEQPSGSPGSHFRPCDKHHDFERSLQSNVDKRDPNSLLH